MRIERSQALRASSKLRGEGGLRREGSRGNVELLCTIVREEELPARGMMLQESSRVTLGPLVDVVDETAKPRGKLERRTQGKRGGQLGTLCICSSVTSEKLTQTSAALRDVHRGRELTYKNRK